MAPLEVIATTERRRILLPFFGKGGAYLGTAEKVGGLKILYPIGGRVRFHGPRGGRSCGRREGDKNVQNRRFMAFDSFLRESKPRNLLYLAKKHESHHTYLNVILIGLTSTAY